MHFVLSTDSNYHSVHVDGTIKNSFDNLTLSLKIGAVVIGVSVVRVISGYQI